MPLTPFIGLSIFIHILLIFLFKICIWLATIFRNFKRSVSASAWFSWLIIIIIFGYVMISATFLVMISAKEEHSTINFFKRNELASFRPLNKTRLEVRTIYFRAAREFQKFYSPKLTNAADIIMANTPDFKAFKLRF